MKRILLSFLVLITFIDCYSQRKAALKAEINPYSYSVVKNIQVKNGAVVSAHALASRAGAKILKQGGNAIDAAITTQLALAVVYPGAGNLGGGGFFVGHLKNGTNITIDFREKAPGNATRDMYLDAQGNARTSLSIDGHLASGVPGTIAGVFASAKYGKLPFNKLIQPAIDLAEKGFVITAGEAANLNNVQTAFKKTKYGHAGICERRWLESRRYARSKRPGKNVDQGS